MYPPWFDFILGVLISCGISSVITFCLPLTERRYRQAIMEDI